MAVWANSLAVVNVVVIALIADVIAFTMGRCGRGGRGNVGRGGRVGATVVDGMRAGASSSSIETNSSVCGSGDVRTNVHKITNEKNITFQHIALRFVLFVHQMKLFQLHTSTDALTKCTNSFAL